MIVPIDKAEIPDLNWHKSYSPARLFAQKELDVFLDQNCDAAKIESIPEDVTIEQVASGLMSELHARNLKSKVSVRRRQGVLYLIRGESDGRKRSAAGRNRPGNLSRAG